jgi:hypothetical protein
MGEERLCSMELINNRYIFGKHIIFTLFLADVILIIFLVSFSYFRWLFFLVASNAPARVTCTFLLSQKYMLLFHSETTFLRFSIPVCIFKNEENAIFRAQVAHLHPLSVQLTACDLEESTRTVTLRSQIKYGGYLFRNATYPLPIKRILTAFKLILNKFYYFFKRRPFPTNLTTFATEETLRKQNVQGKQRVGIAQSVWSLGYGLYEKGMMGFYSPRCRV